MTFDSAILLFLGFSQLQETLEREVARKSPGIICHPISLPMAGQHPPHLQFAAI